MARNIGDIIGTDTIIDIYSGRNNKGVAKTFLKLRCNDCYTDRDVELAKFNYGNARKCGCKTGKISNKSKMVIGTDTYLRDATPEESHRYLSGCSMSKRPCIVIRCNICGIERVTARFKFFGKNGNTSEKCSCYEKKKSSLITKQDKDLRDLLGGIDYNNNIEILELKQDSKKHRLFRVRCIKCSRIRDINAFDYKYRNIVSKHCECSEKYNPYAIYSGEDLHNKVREKYLDIIGKQSGLLTAEDIIAGDEGTLVICKCRCGNYRSVKLSDFISKKVVSCGCISRSFGELTIESILRSLNLNYKTEFTFENLKSPRGYKLRFDFAVFRDDKVALIEFDGKQHIESGHFNNNIKDTEYIKICDKLKNNYCDTMGIHLLRVDYTLDEKVIRDKVIKYLLDINIL